ncbi:MAG: hypothetical protein H6821_12340 [Planctomycetaceae bacterium]|nr:hypothetical protein [Planctomycetales bacterium]MCB9874957.1 hypothetical protein [Planctomycetaceae bacterium]MCB9939388.1 hypothetical protein [Planctomycetaceae bacterium]HRX79065.1 hypothetical protein [Pirellulaceae bacterium]
MWSYLAFAAFLVGASALLLWVHQRAWSIHQLEGLDESTLDFRRRQHRRRMQASAMIGVVGFLVVISLAIVDAIITTALWLVVLSLVVWMLLLAFADMVSSFFHYNQVRDRHVAEHATLQAQVDRLRQREGNGQKHD